VYRQLADTQTAVLQSDRSKDYEDAHLLRSLLSCSDKFKMSCSKCILLFSGEGCIGKFCFKKLSMPNFVSYN
jgi:hypothetical protein